MKKKYQIFISSTFKDLKNERELVIKAILEMGHIPVGMEMFSAGDTQQWKLIQTQIDDCDYYVIISAFTYGSLDGEISYTEKEYDYAVSKDIPILGFIINDGVNWPAKSFDKTEDKIKKLNDFKEKIKNRIVSFWDDKNDLYAKVSISLMKQFNTNPRIGWIKSSEQMGPEVLKEVSRLSNENSKLRDIIQEQELQIENEKKAEFEKLIKTLKHNKREIAFKYEYDNEWSDSTEFTLLNIFNLLAPEFMIESSTERCRSYLGFILKPNKERKIKTNNSTPLNKIKSILADLSALEIIKPSLKKHPVSDKNEYWTLTLEGRQLFREVRREVLDENLSISIDNEEVETSEN
ncbi:DUF4062 domain-containing protein [uncultured Polaribacter sp.]|jgi:hypothetical protein|uniref:DUF4062 domain-containing protein n=1 Tax=uncultured Polaribacter sp. TaxID=174711 RepID=UPI002629F268|nr:DUF4062 domain-containing protein [uncultured Polaribacter sp.]